MRPIIQCNLAVALVVVALLVSGCATTATYPDNRRGGTMGPYIAPDEPGTGRFVDIESYDVISASRSMVSKMLANPLLANATRPPHVILDAKYFRNQSSSRLNTNMLVDELRTELFNAARGRIIFVGREYAGMVEHERRLKREGVTGTGTTRSSARTLGADYRLGGRITDLSNSNAAQLQKYTLIVFEMVDLETGQLVFSDKYAFKKAVRYGKTER